jgi:hypothetical protein
VDDGQTVMAPSAAGYTDFPTLQDLEAEKGKEQTYA